MEGQDNGGVSIKDLPIYSWHNKEEGKEEYARFAKQFKIHLKHLRYLLEPGGVERKLGPHPGPAPALAAARKEWREDSKLYEAKVAKVEEHFASALSALESSFSFATSPRHIIDKATEHPPPGVPDEHWTYMLKFRAAWEALRLEYQPSTVVDVSQLKEQIMSLSDQMPGGFDQFKAEFHRLHTEILATGVADAITPRELNGVVREGIRNPTVWMMVCHPIYSQDPNAPWEATFDAISKLMTSYRQKGIDPYGEAHAGPLIGSTPIAANSANTTTPAGKMTGGKRQGAPTRDSGGRFKKSQRTANFESYSQSKQTTTNSYTSTRQESSKPRNEEKCTRCWQTSGHNYRTCSEAKCICGKPLSSGQVICYNYDNHPSSAKFTDKPPRMLMQILEAYKRGGEGRPVPATTSNNPPKSTITTRNKRKKGVKAMSADIADDLIRRGVDPESLDSES